MDPLTFAEDVEQRKRSMLPLSLGQSVGGTLTSGVKPGQALPMSMRQRLGKIYEDLDKADMQEPDTTALQAWAKQQGQSGDSAMLNALAAQYAGESFQPLQSHFMKRAAAAQEPMKIGSGMLTPEGQYLKDPFAARDSRRTTLERQAIGLEKMISDQDTRDLARQDRLAQNDIANEFRRQGLSLQQRIAEMRAGDDSKLWRAEDNLRGDFDKLTKDLREELGATSKITQIVNSTPPGTKPDAITQQSLVILLNKFLDPGSVVREGEFDRVVKAQGLEGRARNMADRILRGQPLDANTIQQINGLAQFYAKAATNKIQGIANNYSDIAKKRNLDVSSVISDPRFRGGQAPAANFVDFNTLPK
jgi:hypothetical protein